MNIHVRIAAGLIAVGALAAVGYRYLSPKIETEKQIATTDARGTKGRVTIGTDNWVGYFPLCSTQMRKRMRATGYVLNCEDDKADYPKRFAGLKSGSLQFAVSTVDAFLLNGPATGFPGAIVGVIDESKGGDAIVAWNDKVTSLEGLKSLPVPTIAFTPGSPSEHLLRSAAVHFDLPGLRSGKGPWRIETDGSQGALKRLLDRKADVAVLWEPDVSRAIATPGIVKLLSTADTNRLIVDVLVAGRQVLQQDPDMVKAVLSVYFEVIRYYNENPDALVTDLAAETKTSAAQAKAMLGGVAWVGLGDNAQVWLGATPGTSGIVDVVQSTLRVLTESSALSSDPLPDKDPYRIINSQFAASVFTANATGMSWNTEGNMHDQRFSALTDEQWSQLREVGTLKALNVSFQSGTADLSYDGKSEIDKMMEVLRHYPTFRIRVRGHTGLKGDPEQNKQLSGERADAVARYLNITYNVDTNRVQVVGMGSAQPLPRLQSESERAYQYRLPRVEITLLTNGI